jgi:hypothetical protein
MILDRIKPLLREKRVYDTCAPPDRNGKFYLIFFKRNFKEFQAKDIAVSKVQCKRDEYPAHQIILASAPVASLARPFNTLAAY